MQLNYHLLDVFTDKQMEGNPLAVVSRADHIKTWMMQKIANEFALSETIFLMEPKVGRHTAGVRIFTPQNELPFAGHPLIGGAVFLGSSQRSTAIRLEVEIGIVTCIMDRLTKNSGLARFKLPQLPKKIRDAPNASQIAQTLGLNEEQIGFDDYAPACYSAGIEYVLIPVKDQQALTSIKLQRRGWAQVYGAFDVAIYVFCPSEDASEADFNARMFDFKLPRVEDPATGSAAAALIGLLADTSGDENLKRTFFVAQGHDMGRPSFIEAQVGKKNGVLVHAGMGGKAIVIGEGVLNLDWHETV